MFVIGLAVNIKILIQQSADTYTILNLWNALIIGAIAWFFVILNRMEKHVAQMKQDLKAQQVEYDELNLNHALAYKVINESTLLASDLAGKKQKLLQRLPKDKPTPIQ